MVLRGFPGLGSASTGGRCQRLCFPARHARSKPRRTGERMYEHRPASALSHNCRRAPQKPRDRHPMYPVTSRSLAITIESICGNVDEVFRPGQCAYDLTLHRHGTGRFSGWISICAGVLRSQKRKTRRTSRPFRSSAEVTRCSGSQTRRSARHRRHRCARRAKRHGRSPPPASPPQRIGR